MFSLLIFSLLFDAIQMRFNALTFLCVDSVIDIDRVEERRWNIKIDHQQYQEFVKAIYCNAIHHRNVCDVFSIKPLGHWFFDSYILLRDSRCACNYKLHGTWIPNRPNPLNVSLIQFDHEFVFALYSTAESKIK